MPDTNQVKLTGKIGTDPFVRETKKGSTYAKFILLNRPEGRFKDFRLNITAWNEFGVFVRDMCKKGSRVEIMGHIEPNDFKKGDKWVNSYHVIVEDIALEKEDYAPDPEQEEEAYSSPQDTWRPGEEEEEVPF